MAGVPWTHFLTQQTLKMSSNNYFRIIKFRPTFITQVGMISPYHDELSLPPSSSSTPQLSTDPGHSTSSRRTCTACTVSHHLLDEGYRSLARILEAGVSQVTCCYSSYKAFVIKSDSFLTCLQHLPSDSDGSATDDSRSTFVVTVTVCSFGLFSWINCSNFSIKELRGIPVLAILTYLLWMITALIHR